MTKQELQQNYPAYSKSIFSDFMPDDSNVMGWQENVLQKVKGDSILPHYVEKDRDFDTFWGWITHFFAIIVYFGRNFKKFFTNYTEYLDEIGEFMRERDYIQDSRVQINKDLKIPIAEEIYHKIFCNTRLINGVATPTIGYDTTDYLPITDGAVLELKVLGYNQSLGEYSGSAINNINVAYYFADKTLGVSSLANSYSYLYDNADNQLLDNANNELLSREITESMSLTAAQAKNGFRLLCLSNGAQNPYCFIRISYPRLGNASLPLYLGVFLEGAGTSFVTDRTERDIFSVHSDFRKRGTFKGASLIKKILEVKKEDNFHADYLPQVNTGWFLNRNAPTFGRLYKRVQIDALISQSLSVSSGVSTTVTMKEQYLMLNQNTSLFVKWKGNEADSVVFNISVYDKDKNLLSDTPILSGWSYNASNHTLVAGSSGSASVYPRYNETEDRMEAELPIELIDNPKNGVFSTDTYDKYRFINALDKICLFTKYNNSGTREAHYIRITSIVLNGASTPHIKEEPAVEETDVVFFGDSTGAGSATALYYEVNFEVGLYLRKLPITMGFLNNKQYYLCCFKNNGSYSNAEAAEIIGQKVIPYNGYRVFIDNSFYRDNTTIALDLKNIYFDRIFKKIHLEIIGGVPPYSYQLGYLGTPNQIPKQVDNFFQYYQAEISYSQTYEKRITTYGPYKIVVTDALGKKLLVRVSCQPFNNIDYKFRLFVSKDNSIQIFLKLFGGTETSYDVSKYTYSYPYLYDNRNNQLLDNGNNELLSREKYTYSYPYLYDNGNNQLLDNGNNELLSREITELTGDEKITMPANVWIDVTKVIGSNFNQITEDMSLYIRDNGIPVEARTWLIDEYNDLELNLQELLCDFALDFYDNGVGELVN